MNTMKITGAKFHTWKKIYSNMNARMNPKVLYWTLKYRREVNDIEITRCKILWVCLYMCMYFLTSSTNRAWNQKSPGKWEYLALRPWSMIQIFSSKRNHHSLEKWLIPGLQQETLEDFVRQESKFSSAQSLSHVRLFASPWTAARQASQSITNSRGLLKLMPIESVMPYNHLILCRPLLLMLSIFLINRVFTNESVLPIRGLKYWNFSFSISPSNEHPGLISFRMDQLDLLAVQGTLKSLLQICQRLWLHGSQKKQTNKQKKNLCKTLIDMGIPPYLPPVKLSCMPRSSS